MEEKTKIYKLFLLHHARRARPEPDRAVYACFYNPKCAMHEQTLVVMRQDDLVDALNVESELVRWLCKQFNTYDTKTQRILALIFDRDTVLSDVLRVEAGDQSQLSKDGDDDDNTTAR